MYLFINDSTVIDLGYICHVSFSQVKKVRKTSRKARQTTKWSSFEPSLLPLLLHQESVSEAKRVFQTQSEERAEKREAPEATHEYSGPHYDSSSRRVQTDKFLGLLQQFACVVHIDQK